jgi:hypothetical protein
MARFRCGACSAKGAFRYAGHVECPHCASADVVLAIGPEGMTDDDIDLFEEFVSAFRVPDE